MKGDGTVAVSAGGDELAALRETYLEALLAPDARGAQAMLEQAADGGIPVGHLYLEVLQPAMHEIGRLWEQARIGVAHEHLATQITQSVLARLSARLAHAGVGHGRKAIVSCSPGEMHAVGGQMVADFLESDGWKVLALGADTPPGDLARLAEEEEVELVALSTALPAHLLAAGASCAALRRLSSPPFIVAGGQAFRGDEARARAVGADAYAADPAQLLALLAQRFGTGARATG